MKPLPETSALDNEPENRKLVPNDMNTADEEVSENEKAEELKINLKEAGKDYANEDVVEQAEKRVSSEEDESREIKIQSKEGDVSSENLRPRSEENLSKTPFSAENQKPEITEEELLRLPEHKYQSRDADVSSENLRPKSVSIENMMLANQKPRITDEDLRETKHRSKDADISSENQRLESQENLSMTTLTTRSKFSSEEEQTDQRENDDKGPLELGTQYTGLRQEQDQVITKESQFSSELADKARLKFEETDDQDHDSDEDIFDKTKKKVLSIEKDLSREIENVKSKDNYNAEKEREEVEKLKEHLSEEEGIQEEDFSGNSERKTSGKLGIWTRLYKKFYTKSIQHHHFMCMK